ncbi:MAG: hypothetical protein KJ999_21675 [Gammaproteobacteria bacterium]|nr:hypothetical protein [Gammaproteobacteria bacterium]
MKIDTSHTKKGAIKRMGAVLEFLKENHYKTHRTRVEYYQKILDRFSESPVLTDVEAWALTELHEIFVVVEGAKINDHIKNELARCLKGVHLLEDESVKKSGNAPRNASFELFIVSKMVIFESKISIPQFGQSADINFYYAGRLVPIECKRLYASGKVSRIVQETCSQVSKRVNDGEYGIAAISLTREFWSTVSSAVMESIEEARQAVEKVYLQWREKIAKQLGSYPKVALIYIHIQLPFVGENKTFYVYEREFFRTRFNYKRLPEAPIVDDFIEVMTNKGIMDAIEHHNPSNDSV